MRFTPDELLVLRLSLGLEDVDAAQLLEVESHGAEIVAPYEPPVAERPALDRMLHALSHECCVEIDYATTGTAEVTTRTIHPHQVLVSGGRTYVVAWCELRGEWRRFRMDRILELRDSIRPFVERDDCPIDEIFDAEDLPDQVRVRFSPSIARWMVERYPAATREDDGSATVTYEAASVDWLVERVLQYGVDAEVLEPGLYRHAVHKGVS